MRNLFEKERLLAVDKTSLVLVLLLLESGPPDDNRFRVAVHFVEKHRSPLPGDRSPDLPVRTRWEGFGNLLHAINVLERCILLRHVEKRCSKKVLCTDFKKSALERRWKARRQGTQEQSSMF